MAALFFVPLFAACGFQPTAEITRCDDHPPDLAEANEQALSAFQMSGGSLPDGALSLTFDDGPSDRTEELGEYLAAQGIQATFFVNGRNVYGREPVLAKLAALGHLVGNHTQTHQDLTTLDAQAVYEEVDRTDDLIARHVVDGAFFLRPPFGAWNEHVFEALQRTHLSKYVGGVFWNIGGSFNDRYAADWACWGRGVAVPECAERYLAETKERRRGVVLLHDSHSRTVDLTYALVPMLQSEGFRFVRLDAVPVLAAQLGRPVPQEDGGLPTPDGGDVVTPDAGSQADAGRAPFDGGAPDAGAGAPWNCSRSFHQGEQLWTCSGSARYRCDADGQVEVEHCPSGCRVHALGQNDTCI